MIVSCKKLLSTLVFIWIAPALAQTVPLATEERFSSKLSISLESFSSITDCPIDIAVRSVLPGRTFRTVALLTGTQKEASTALSAGRYLIRATEVCEKGSSLVPLPRFMREEISDFEIYLHPTELQSISLTKSCSDGTKRCFVKVGESAPVYSSVDIKFLRVDSNTSATSVEYQIMAKDGSEKFSGFFEQGGSFQPVLTFNKQYLFKFRESDSVLDWIETELRTGQAKVINLRSNFPRFNLYSDEPLSRIPSGVAYEVIHKAKGRVIAKGFLKEPNKGVYLLEANSPMYESEAQSDDFELVMSYKDPEGGTQKSLTLPLRIGEQLPIPDLLGLESLSIHKSILESLSSSEIEYLEKKYKLLVMTSEGVIGVIASVQSVDRSTPGSSQSGDFFLNNQLAQQADRNTAEINRGGKGMSATEWQLFGALASALGSGLNESPEAKFIHRYHIRTASDRIQSIDKVSSDEFFIPVGTCVSVKSGDNISEIDPGFCKKPSVEEFRARHLSSLSVKTRNADKEESPQNRSTEVIVRCRVGKNPIIEVDARTCISIGGKVQGSSFKCQFGSNMPIELEPSKCLQAKGKLVQKP